MKILRWLVLLPAALLGAILVDIGLVIFNMILTAFGEGGHPRWIQFVGSILSGYFFVKIGTQIAPSHERTVAIALAALVGAGSVATFWLSATIARNSISDPLWWIGVCGIAGILAAAVSAFRAFFDFPEPSQSLGSASTAGEEVADPCPAPAPLNPVAHANPAAGDRSPEWAVGNNRAAPLGGTARSGPQRSAPLVALDVNDETRYYDLG